MIRIPLLLLAAGALAAGDAEPPKHPGGGDGPQGGRPNPRAIFDKMDANHDGKVTQEEFLAFKPGEGRPPGPPPGDGGEGRPPGPPPGEGGEGPMEGKLFEKLDTDKDGKLSREEFAKLRELMRELRENHPGGPGQGRPREEIFKRLDKDGDGAVTFEEFEAGRPKPPGEGRPGGDGKPQRPGKPGEGGGER